MSGVREQEQLLRCANPGSRHSEPATAVGWLTGHRPVAHGDQVDRHRFRAGDVRYRSLASPPNDVA